MQGKNFCKSFFPCTPLQNFLKLVSVQKLNFVISNGNALDFVLFGAILDTIKQTVVSQYANLPQTDSLSETAEYAIKNLNCDIEMLAAIKDYLLINPADELIRQKIEGEFTKIQL